MYLKQTVLNNLATLVKPRAQDPHTYYAATLLNYYY